jgi:hypothetical protein
MSARTQIVKALASKLNTLINGSSPYTSNLYGKNAITKQKFWDEVNDFPTVCVIPSTETREYLPGAFQWGFLNIALKLYVKSEEESASKLEELIQDVELVLETNEELQLEDGREVTEILIQSIITDEGLLAPYGVGEINISVRYQV